MPDNMIDKLHRMARQQKNNPGLVFANRNLNPDEYDDDEDDETYHDDDSTSDDEEEVLNYNEEEDNDLDEDAEENDTAPEPPVVEIDDDVDDDNNDGDVAEADVQPPAEAEQPEDGANQNEEDDEADAPEIQGVDEDVIEPEAPGVGTVAENEEGEGEEDQPTDGAATGQPPPAPPQGNNNADGRYDLRNNRNRNYGHRYAGKDFIIDSVAMTTHGTSEVLETPQMSLKAGLRTFGNDGVKAVEKEMRQLHDRGIMTPVHKNCLTDWSI